MLDHDNFVELQWNDEIVITMYQKNFKGGKEFYSSQANTTLSMLLFQWRGVLKHDHVLWGAF